MQIERKENLRLIFYQVFLFKLESYKTDAETKTVHIPWYTVNIETIDTQEYTHIQHDQVRKVNMLVYEK